MTAAAPEPDCELLWARFADRGDRERAAALLIRHSEEREPRPGINPFANLADVIPRVQDHSKRRLDGLLPGPWVRAQAAA